MKKLDNKVSNVSNATKLRNFLLLTLFFYACATILCKNILLGACISVPSSIILICIYFIKTHKKEISEKEYLGYIGFSSTFSCIVCASIASVVAMRFSFTAILFGIIILLIIILEIGMHFISEKKYSAGVSIAATIVGAPSALAGMTMARYMRENNIEIKYEYIIGAIAVVFAFFYCALIKYRKLKHQERQPEQSGDGSVIDD